MRWQGANLSEAKRIGNRVLAGSVELCECCGSLVFTFQDGSVLSLEPCAQGFEVWAFDADEWQQRGSMH